LLLLLLLMMLMLMLLMLLAGWLAGRLAGAAPLLPSQVLQPHAGSRTAAPHAPAARHRCTPQARRRSGCG
jgi:hypothetical protein